MPDSKHGRGEAGSVNHYGPTVEQPQAGRDNFIATSLVVNNFFGGQPGEDGERLLAAYLKQVIKDCQHMRLNRLLNWSPDQAPQPGPARRLALDELFTSLTTDAPWQPLHQPRTRTVRQLRKLSACLDRMACSLNEVVPEQARHLRLHGTAATQLAVAAAPAVSDGTAPGASLSPHQVLHRLDEGEELAYTLNRPELVLESVYRNRLLVLLGEPGAGKSTVLRYLALRLARRLSGKQVAIPGWPEADTPVPILVPLGRVSGALSSGAQDAYTALIKVIGDVLEEGFRDGLRRFVVPSLRDGGVLLLCDGLDELPASTDRRNPSVRAAVATALDDLAKQTHARIVVTSRLLPYKASLEWQLPADEEWEQRIIQPLALGQVRDFVNKALGKAEAAHHQALAEQRAATLIAEIEKSPQLLSLAGSPLLLAMLVSLYNRASIVSPDRIELYEQFIVLLLEHWERERQPELPRQTLAERLTLPSLDPMRAALSHLAFEAHTLKPREDGRGIITTELLRRCFERTMARDLGLRWAEEFRAIILQDDAGLLQRRGEDDFAFPHLTFQEYLAARHLASLPAEQMVELVCQYWQGEDRERWRIVLQLLIGQLVREQKVFGHALPLLSFLVTEQPREAGAAPHAQPAWRHRSALLAALVYQDLVARNALASTLIFDLRRDVERRLAAASVALLNQADVAIAVGDRLSVARMLGPMGDTRFPVALVAWRRSVLQERPAQPGSTGDHYWRAVGAGVYRIGGWKRDEQPVDLELAPFWIARLPITVAQFAAFVAAGYADESESRWTRQGLAWKRRRARPEHWNYGGYHEPNQPVTLITWYEASAYCAWLTEQLADVLPAGYVVRLPTEAEWEAAAAADSAGTRRLTPWAEGPVTPERAIYDALALTTAAPVGCCPGGAAPSGALDLLGNVWEWTCSSYRSYPHGAASRLPGFAHQEWDVPLRGGSFSSNATALTAGARASYNPQNHSIEFGFRVVLGQPLGG